MQQQACAAPAATSKQADLQHAKGNSPGFKDFTASLQEHGGKRAALAPGDQSY
jgi:hypothetical protein